MTNDERHHDAIEAFTEGSPTSQAIIELLTEHLDHGSTAPDQHPGLEKLEEVVALHPGADLHRVKMYFAFRPL